MEPSCDRLARTIIKTTSSGPKKKTQKTNNNNNKNYLRVTKHRTGAYSDTADIRYVEGILWNLYEKGWPEPSK